MRVIAGSAKGRRLTTPRGQTTRPTSDRVKEALFSTLTSMDCLEGAAVLDLFAGSGSLGIEALSRGAASSIFVENHTLALKALQLNVALCGLQDKARILPYTVQRSLETLRDQAQRFDLVFLDPPYQSGLYEQVLNQVAALVTPDAIIVAESARSMPLPDRIGLLVKSDRRVYGDTALEFFVTEQRDAP